MSFLRLRENWIFLIETLFFSGKKYGTGFQDMDCFHQGFYAREVISEVYASFVLQCTVTGR